jgi:hypothetical protein
MTKPEFGTQGDRQERAEAEQARFDRLAQGVVCRECKAPVGEPCRTPSGRTRTRHGARGIDAVKSGLFRASED